MTKESDWVFAVKNARHLEDAIHKRIAGLDVTTKLLAFRSLLLSFV